MVAFWQAGCHLWICQHQDARCFQSNRTRVPAPCCQEALPSSCHSAKLFFHSSLSRVDRGGKAAGENSREPLIQTHSSLRITELKNSLHTGLGFASRHTFYRMEIATEMIFMFYFTGTRGWSLVKRTTEMEGKDKLYLIFKPVPLFSSSPFCWTFNSTFVKIQQGNCLNFF